MSGGSPPPAARLYQMVTGSWLAQAISVAAKLRIADQLAVGPRDAAALAEATGTHAPSLYRLLRALASVGIFAEDGAGRFHLTPLAELLRSDAPNSLRAFAEMLGEPWHWLAWGGVLHSVRTGEPALDHVFGMGLFDYLERNPEAAALFDAAMTSRGHVENPAVVAAYSFSDVDTLVDVAGGEGTLLAAVAEAYPVQRAVLFDLPHVVERARSRLAASSLADRFEAVAGDFFAAVPAGGDAYMLKKIIHDWDDERSVAILRNCRQVMPAHGRLLLIESVIPPGNEPYFGKLLDLLMLVWTPGGRERTEAEYRALLAQAGFELRRVVPTASPVSVIEARPV